MFEAPVAASSLARDIDAAADEIEARVIAWRRDIHQHPELGNREFRTAGIVAEHLQAARLRRGAREASPTPAWSAC